MPSREDQRLLDSLNNEHAGGLAGKYAIYLVLLRVFLGWKFLQAGLAKLPLLQDAEPLRKMITPWATNQTHPFWGYQEFLQNVVLPNLPTFANLVVWGELAVGVALLVGGMARLAAFFALFMTVNYWFAQGYVSPAAAGINEAFSLMALLVLLAGAGRVLGLDAFLAHRLPRSPFW